MGNHEKTVLSKKNQHYISKHRYLELKHFCLQYPEWMEALKEIDGMVKSGGGEIKSDPQASDPTADAAIRRTQLQKNIDLIERTIRETDSSLFYWLFLAVTEERSYTYLKEVKGIPCCREVFYKKYREFFYAISQKKLVLR